MPSRVNEEPEPGSALIFFRERAGFYEKGDLRHSQLDGGVVRETSVGS